MKLNRGDYDGASWFAQFDKSLDRMTALEMRCLLEHILHRASPGDNEWSGEMYRQLQIVEDLAREQGANL
jgi:hypothetical protein